MAEVRGSSPLGSTSFFFRFAGETSKNQEARGRVPALLDDRLTRVGTALGEYVFHRTRVMGSHSGDHVGIDVERDRHGGVAQEFLDVLGVHVAAQQQRRAGVPQVVKAYLR